MPGTHGGCYQLAAELGLAAVTAQEVRVVPYPQGGFAVMVVLGQDQRSAFLRMMQPPPGALPPSDPGHAFSYGVPATLAIVQNGKVLRAFPPIVGIGTPGTPITLQIDGLTRAQADDLGRRLGV